jgi:hypothetical protein
MKAMEFITLTTGATAMSSRNEVADSVIAQIGQALAADGTLWAGWSVTLSSTITSYARIDRGAGAAGFLMTLHDVAMSRCMVCWDKTVSDEAWETVQEAVPEQVVVHRPRGVPWLAVAILPGVLQHPMQLMELADAERCVAWALIGAAKGPN